MRSLNTHTRGIIRLAVRFGLGFGVLAAASPPAAVEGPGVVFQKEHIKIFVGEKNIRVHGLYTFVNPQSSFQRATLFYPIPVDSMHPSADYILVRSGGSVLAAHAQKDGAFFGVEIPAGESRDVEVIYEQTCADGSGCYILTSTAAWERPLEQARFEIHVPDGIALERMSYEADRVNRGKGERVHEFTRFDFMPETDLCLAWRVHQGR